MKFSPIETFQHTPQGLSKEAKKGVAFSWEQGNSYDSVVQGLSDAEVMSFHAAGWAEVEGQNAAPERSTTGVELKVNKPVHAEETQPK
jgi:hypothetical protein